MSEKYLNELEEKVVNLSLALKQQNGEIKAIHANHAKMITNLIHNLKNPIGVIFSFSEMILEAEKNNTNERLKKHLGIINKSSSFSLKLIEAIGVYSRLNSPYFELHKSSRNLYQFTQSVVDQFVKKNSLDPMVITIESNNQDFVLDFDEKELGITLNHLLSNALRFSTAPFAITISLKADTSFAIIEVKDNGIGMNAEDLGKVFEIFNVVNTYDQNQIKCIGLGLTIVKNIVEKHGGSIQIFSEINKGTTVQMRIPR